MKRQKSILVLDDEVVLCSLIRDLLSPVYEEVIACSSSFEAKKLVSERSFSMILTDVKMPDLSGAEFVKFLRSLGKMDPVIFITGYATKDFVLTALRLGAADVLEKPFDNDELLQTIDRVFEIEKRRLQLYETLFTKKDAQDAIGGQKRMIGLLQVANEKK